jgi:hypothetical protein
MSVSVPEDLPGIDQANAELDRLMAADAAQEQGAGSKEQGAPGKEESANSEAQRAGQQGQETAQSDTPAASEKKDGSGERGAGKTEKAEIRNPKSEKDEGKEAAAGTKEPSRFAKAKERQEKSWAQLNSEKETLKREREDFDRLRKEHEERVARTEKQFSPEEYEAAAKKFEDAGKFDLAEAARDKAAALRKNPDQGKQQQDAASREWTLKAGIDFPEVAKANSPVQVRVAQLLKEEPELKAHPKGIYMAARLASLEHELTGAKAGAASVSVKDKEITELKTKIKELEQATAPGHGGAATVPRGAKSFGELSDEEQYAELERQARETGTLR